MILELVVSLGLMLRFATLPSDARLGNAPSANSSRNTPLSTPSQTARSILPAASSVFARVGVKHAIRKNKRNN